MKKTSIWTSIHLAFLLRELLGGLVLATILTGCQPHQEAIQSAQHLGGDMWRECDTLSFPLSITHDSVPYSMELFTRHDNRCNHCTISLLLHISDSLGWQRVDTLHLTLAEFPGRWKGAGVALIQTEFKLPKLISFPREARYTLQLSPLCPKPPLPEGMIRQGFSIGDTVFRGIETVGVRLTPVRISR